MKKLLLILLLQTIAIISCENKSEERIFPDFPPEDTVKIEFDFSVFEKRWEEITDKKVKPKHFYRTYPIKDSLYNSSGGWRILDTSFNGYLESRFNGIFGDLYTFFPSGKLKSRGFFFSKDGESFLFRIRNTYYFDEQGKLTDLRNEDKNYPFNTDSIIVFLKNKGLNVSDKSVLRVWRREEKVQIKASFNSVNRKGTGVYVWDLEYVLPDTKELRGVTLSAKDGAILVDTLIDKNFNGQRTDYK